MSPTPVTTILLSTCIWVWHFQLPHVSEIIQYLSFCAEPTSLVTMSSVQFSSVIQLYLTLWDPMDCSTPGFPVHYQLPELTQTHVHWVGDASKHLILCHTLLFLTSFFPASGSFLRSQFFAWGSQSSGALASASVLPKNIQDWFPLGLTGWIFLQCKGVSRVFSNNTVQKHQFFGA